MSAPSQTDEKKAPSRPGALASLSKSFRSWRTTAVTLQQFPSGLPLGCVLIAVPAWLATIGVDIKTIGFITLSQAPWTFKFLWSPLMDRYAPPFFGRRRGWAVLAQIALFLSTLGLALAATRPDHVAAIGLAATLIAFAAATQDIAIDAYAVEVLEREEQGVAAGARSAVSRFALTLAGRISIWASKYVSWPALFAVQSLFYIPAAVVSILSPEPAVAAAPPRTLRDAVWEPFVGFLRQNRAIEIALFLVLYKFADNLASSLVSPFLLHAGYNTDDVGLWFFWIGFLGAIIGGISGGAITSSLGLGHSLWLFGFLQAFSNIGYVLIAQSSVSRPLMCTAMSIEAITTGMGTGAFGVLLLRLTQKRFSATQYALLSSIFALGRTISGPIAGVLIDAIGWRDFFIVTIFAAVPGLIMLQRFVPFGTKDIEFAEEPPARGAAVARRTLMAQALTGSLVGLVFGALASTSLEALKTLRTNPSAGFDLASQLRHLVSPGSTGDWIWVAGVLVFAATCGIGSAALRAARRSPA